MPRLCRHVNIQDGGRELHVRTDLLGIKSAQYGLVHQEGACVDRKGANDAWTQAAVEASRAVIAPDVPCHGEEGRALERGRSRGGVWFGVRVRHHTTMWQGREGKSDRPPIHRHKICTHFLTVSAGIPNVQNTREANPPDKKFAVGVLICWARHEHAFKRYKRPENSPQTARTRA